MAYEFYQLAKNKKNVYGIVAPFEADAQLAYLNRNGIVDFIISEDSDLLAFGSKRVFFKLDNMGAGEEICSEDFPKNTEMSFQKWNSNMFLYMCIISGCDYLPNIKGNGIKQAHKMVADFKHYLSIL
jgi:exonuclease 1